MKTRFLPVTALAAAVIFMAGCEFKLGPSNFWDKCFVPETDTEY